jgi:hypothetical protein
MNRTTRRDFFRNIFLTGAALAVTGKGPLPRQAEAADRGRIRGICLYVPTLGRANEFVELMNRNAPGDWQAHPLEGSLNERYFRTRDLYARARGEMNTFVGVVDPASFSIIHEAVVDSDGGFHYVTYEERNRVTFSARL